MSKKMKKSTKRTLIQALVDLIIGSILIILDKVLN